MATAGDGLSLRLRLSNETVAALMAKKSQPQQLGTVFPGGSGSGMNEELMRLTPLRASGSANRAGGLLAKSRLQAGPVAVTPAPATALVIAASGAHAEKAEVDVDADADADELEEIEKEREPEAPRDEDVDEDAEEGAPPDSWDDPEAMASLNVRAGDAAQLALQEDGEAVVLVDLALYGSVRAHASRQLVFEELVHAGSALEELCEGAFEVGVFVHSVRGRADADARALERLRPGHRFVSVDYPANHFDEERGGAVATSQLWEAMSATSAVESEFPAVRQLKAHVRDCSRPLLWKRSILTEIDDLALREDIARLERDELAERVAALRRVQAELRAVCDDAAQHDDVEVGTTCGLELEALSVELRTAAASLARGRAEEEARASKRAGKADEARKAGKAGGGGSGSRSGDREMSVVDMILAMALQRQPLLGATLGKAHGEVVAAWEEEFGRLPFLDCPDEDADDAEGVALVEDGADVREQQEEEEEEEDDEEDEEVVPAPAAKGDARSLDDLVAWIGTNNANNKNATGEEGAKRTKKTKKAVKKRVASRDWAKKQQNRDSPAAQATAKARATRRMHKGAAEADSEAATGAEAEAGAEAAAEAAAEAVAVADDVTALVGLLGAGSGDGDGEGLRVLDVRGRCWRRLARRAPAHSCLLLDPETLAGEEAQEVLDEAFLFVAETDDVKESLAKSVLQPDVLRTWADSGEDLEMVNQFLNFKLRLSVFREAAPHAAPAGAAPQSAASQSAPAEPQSAPAAAAPQSAPAQSEVVAVESEVEAAARRLSQALARSDVDVVVALEVRSAAQAVRVVHAALHAGKRFFVTVLAWMDEPSAQDQWAEVAFEEVRLNYALKPCMLTNLRSN